MATGPKRVEMRGGYRPSAGRKPTPTIVACEVSALAKTVKRACRDNNTSVSGELAKLILQNSDLKMKAQAVRIYYEVVAPMATEQHPVQDEIKGPVIYALPEEKPDPAWQVPKK